MITTRLWLWKDEDWINSFPYSIWVTPPTRLTKAELTLEMKRLNHDTSYWPLMFFRLHCIWKQWVWLSTMTGTVKVQITPLFWNEKPCFDSNSVLFQVYDGCYLGKYGVAYVKCWACDAWQVTSYEPTTTVISIRRNSRPQNAIMLSEWTCWSDRSDHTLSICSPQLKRFVLQWYCPTIRLAREGLTDHASQHGRHTYLLLDCHY